MQQQVQRPVYEQQSQQATPQHQPDQATVHSLQGTRPNHTSSLATTSTIFASLNPLMPMDPPSEASVDTSFGSFICTLPNMQYMTATATSRALSPSSQRPVEMKTSSITEDMRSKGKKQETISEEALEIGNRLFKHHTKSTSGDVGEPASARDLISKKNVDADEVDEITERLYSTDIIMRTVNPDEAAPKAQDTISKGEMKKSEIDESVDRLNTTFPECQSGNMKAPQICTNSIAREPAPEEEVKAIYDRLRTTHTKSSSGGIPCKEHDPPNAPGYGLKCYPIIEGIETKFKGDKPENEQQFKDNTERLLKTQTCNSQARIDNPKILLYPERTKLMNNVDRIKMYQDSGAMVKQKEMERREKWFN